MFNGTNIDTNNVSMLMPPVSSLGSMSNAVAVAAAAAAASSTSSSSAAALSLVTPCNITSSRSAEHDPFRCTTLSTFPESTLSSKAVTMKCVDELFAQHNNNTKTTTTTNSSINSSHNININSNVSSFATVQPVPVTSSKMTQHVNSSSSVTSSSSSSSSSFGSVSVPPSLHQSDTPSIHSSHTPARKKQSTRDPFSHRMIEKRRRDRMNNCLTDLSHLIPNSFMKKQSSSLQNRGRIEKTEIIEMAIKYLKHLQSISEPLLIEDGPLGPSPNTTPLPSIDHDQLFKLCNSHSQNSAALLIKDRYQYYRLGYQECFTETVHFLEENGLENLYGKLLEQLQSHRENISVGIISKHMMNSNPVTNCDDFIIPMMTKTSPISTSVNNQNSSLFYVPKVATSETSNVEPNGSFTYDNMATHVTNGNVSSGTGITASGGCVTAQPAGPLSSMLTLNNQKPNYTPNTTDNVMNKSQYSLEAIKFLIESKSMPNELNSVDNQQSALSPGQCQANLASSLENTVNGPTNDISIVSLNMINKAKLKADQTESNKNVKQCNNNIASNEVYNFKKEIKDRFQKVMERMSDGSRNSSSVSSLNSETDAASNGNSTEYITPSHNYSLSSSQIKKLTELDLLGKLPNGSNDLDKSRLLSDTNSHSYQVNSDAYCNILNTKGTELTESLLFHSVSAKLLMTLSSLISSLSSPTVKFVQVFALHPSGQYYVPLRIEASMLGLDNLTKSQTLPKQNNGMKAKRQFEAEKTESNDVDCSSRGMKKGRIECAEDDEQNESTFVNTKLNVNFGASKQVESEGEEEEEEKSMLYPINITVNIAFKRTITMASLFASLRNFLISQMSADNGTVVRSISPHEDELNVLNQKLVPSLENNNSDNESEKLANFALKKNNLKSNTSKVDLLEELTNGSQNTINASDQATAAQMMMMLAAAALDDHITETQSGGITTNLSKRKQSQEGRNHHNKIGNNFEEIKMENENDSITKTLANKLNQPKVVCGSDGFPSSNSYYNSSFMDGNSELFGQQITADTVNNANYLPQHLASQLSYYNSLWPTQLSSNYPPIDFQTANAKHSTINNTATMRNPNPFMLSLFANSQQQGDFRETPNKKASTVHTPPGSLGPGAIPPQLKSKFDCYNQLMNNSNHHHHPYLSGSNQSANFSTVDSNFGKKQQAPSSLPPPPVPSADKQFSKNVANIKSSNSESNTGGTNTGIVPINLTKETLKLNSVMNL